MGYSRDVVSGVSWIGILSLLTKILGLFEVLIIAKLLLPEQFGAYGVALLALGVLEVLTETGVNVFLLQEEDKINDFISSAWIVSILRGVFITSILILIAPFVADFFHSRESLPLLYLISLASLLRGFINPAIVKFQKELSFSKDFWLRLSILSVDTVVAVTVTFITRSPIGIILGLIAGIMTELILSFLIVEPRPKLKFNKTYINLIFHRGKWVTASGIFDYLFHNADNITVGRLLGPASLGVYQLAYSASVIPLTEIGRVFKHVTFPVFTKISNNPQRLKSAYLKTIISVILITSPIMFVLLFFPNLFVAVLGSKWASVGSILPVLALLGFFKAVTVSSSALFFSQKKQNYATIITFINVLVLCILIVPLVIAKGILGAGLAGLMGSILAIPAVGYFSYKLINK